ncbi:hypothetical protein GJ496_002065 [Pomphorhynchus laevis]|nr:hypothetical protein GJ496_002065 [Pomphorhynchus laevis]
MIINRDQNPAIAAKLVRKDMIGKVVRLLKDKTVKESLNTLHPNASEFYEDCVLKHPLKNRAEHHEAFFSN